MLVNEILKPFMHNLICVRFNASTGRTYRLEMKVRRIKVHVFLDCDLCCGE